MNKKNTDKQATSTPVDAGSTEPKLKLQPTGDPAALPAPTDPPDYAAIAEGYYDYRCWAVPLAWRRGAREDAEDLFHEVLLSLLRAHKPSHHSFDIRLRRRFYSRCAGDYRTRMNHRPSFVELPDGFEELVFCEWEDHPASDEWKLLHQHIASLPENERSLLSYCYWEGLPLAKIAERLGISEAAVKSLLFRIRLKLRGKLQRPLAWGQPRR